MPTVLRNGRTIQNEGDGPAPKAAVSSSTPRQRPSSALLLVYPVLLALGSLYSVISPTAIPPPVTPLAPGVTSDVYTPPTAHATNYFSGKRNVFNLFFVKIGWFWTTLAFVMLQATTRPPPATSRRHYVQASCRYALVTMSWFLTTQWFFGPALIDRSFTITGGQCEPYPVPAAHDGAAPDLVHIHSSLVCKAAGGRWRGGHDISGHVFMLVLSSAFLLYELYIADRDSSHPSVSPRAAAALAHDMSEEERKAVGGWESETIARIRVWSRYFLYVVVGLDFWMLMMTAIWFHTWLEKLSGLLLAAVTVWAVFFLGDFVPQWRALIGGL